MSEFERNLPLVAPQQRRLRGRDASYLAPPAQIRTCGFPAYGLYGAFAVKGTSHRFLSCCCFILLFDPRREHSSVPTAYYHRRRAQRGSRTALLQRRRRLVLDHREHGGRLPAIGWSAAQRSEGSLPLAASDRRANHACIRLNPHRVSTMKQSYASAGKAPKRRVHSPIGIVAIAVCGLPPPRIVIGLPGASNAVRCRTCLSFLALECCSRRRAQLDTVRHLTGRDQAPQRYQQFARQCHDHCRLARATRTLGPRAIPPRQRTVFLEHQEAPRQLNQPTSYPRIAGP